MPRRVMSGVVVSTKMDKTVVVRVERSFTHPKYHKIVRLSKKYSAHDENNQCVTGQKVDIIESKPISKTKKWVVCI